MERCFAEALAPPQKQVSLEEGLIPRIALDPEPATWPEPTDFVSDDSKEH